MANLIDADLLLDTLSNKALKVLGNRLAPLSAFTLDVTPDELPAQTKYVQVPIATAVPDAVQTTPTNFETNADTNTSNVGVQVNHYSKSFHVTSAQYNQKITLDMLAGIQADTFANKIIDVALAPVADAQFGAQNIIVAAASIAQANLATVWAGVAKNDRKTLLLDATSYSKLLPTSLTALDVRTAGAYGFDSVHLNTRWTGAGANVYGFAAGPGAIAIVSGIPAMASNNLVNSRIITLEGLGISVQVNTWFSAASRTQWASYDVMFGAKFGGDTAAGFIIRSAAE